MKYLVIALVCLLLSCNRAVLVDKSRIVHDTSGYLFYYHTDKCIFLPTEKKEPEVDNFLNDTAIKKGYLLPSVCGIDGFKNTAKKVHINMAYQDENSRRFVLADSIYINATNLKYLPKKRSHVDFNDIIEFEYQGKIFRIDVSDDFYGEILKVPGNTI